MNDFNPVLFFVNMMAYAVLMGVAPHLMFAVMLATNNQLPTVTPNVFN